MLLGAEMVAVMPSTLMLGDIQRGALRLGKLPGQMLKRPAGLVRRREALSASTGGFVAILRQYAAELATGSSPEL